MQSEAASGVGCVRDAPAGAAWQGAWPDSAAEDGGVPEARFEASEGVEAVVFKTFDVGDCKCYGPRKQRPIGKFTRT